MGQSTPNRSRSLIQFHRQRFGHRSSLENHSVDVSFLKKKWVPLIIFIVTMSSILTQLKVKEKVVKSLDIFNSFLFYLKNPQYVLCPLPNDIVPWVRTIYHCVLIPVYLTDFNTTNLHVRTFNRLSIRIFTCLSSQEQLVQFTKGKGIHVPFKEESCAFQTWDNNKKCRDLLVLNPFTHWANFNNTRHIG